MQTYFLHIRNLSLKNFFKILWSAFLTCIIRPDVTIGEIPSSISVPDKNYCCHLYPSYVAVNHKYLQKLLFTCLHTSIWCENYTNPIKRISRIRWHYTKQRNLYRKIITTWDIMNIYYQSEQVAVDFCYF